MGISTLRDQRLKRLAENLPCIAAVRSAFLPRSVPTVQERGPGLGWSVAGSRNSCPLAYRCREQVDPGAGLQRIVGRRPSLGHQAD
jgi:hypothetical protein